MNTVLALVILFTTFVALSALSFQQSHHFSQKNIAHMASSQNLTLRLDAAARGGYPISFSYLQIHWNDVLVSKWLAPDYQIYHLQFNVTAKNGFNNLSFSYPTASTYGGSCFTNVSLKDQDNKELVVDGNFTGFVFTGGSQAQFYTPTHALNGWATLSQFEVGLNVAQNDRFTTNAASVSDMAPSVYQTFNLTIVSQGIITLNTLQKLTLSLDVAARDQAARGLVFALSVSNLNIYWNNVLVTSWNAPDYDIHHLSFKVIANNGTNTLSFNNPSGNIGGACFSNVSLKTTVGKQLVVNGNFTTTIGDEGYSYYTQNNNVQGWSTSNQYGVGLNTVYNPRFPSTLASLDNYSPSVFQTFNINTEYQSKCFEKTLTLKVDVAACQDLVYTLLQIFWNGVLIQDWTSQDKQIHTLTLPVTPRNGLNTLQFRADSIKLGGAVFKNASLKGPQYTGDLIVNGNFEAALGTQRWIGYTFANNILGWKTHKSYAIGTNYFNNKFTGNVCVLHSELPSIYQTFNIECQDGN